MKTVAFIISKKENEKRRAILPWHLQSIRNKNLVYVETGYGSIMGISDSEFEKAGVKICSRNEAMKKDIIVDPKIGDAKYLHNLKEGAVLFGWLHLVQNKKLTDLCIEKRFSTYCWENMFTDSTHVFYRNNEIAGEAAILHAFQCCGKMPEGRNVAVLGNGNVARGAIKTLTALGAKVRVYVREEEKLFQKEFANYDVIVNAILWDTSRNDHILYKKDIKKMKKNSLIIDISCDHNGGIESSHPTTIKKPIYKFSNVFHYAVDHAPSIFFYESSNSISKEVSKYIDDIIEDKPNAVLKNSLGIQNGFVLDQKIMDYQNR